MLKLSLLTEDTNKPVTKLEMRLINALEMEFGVIPVDELYYDTQSGMYIMEHMTKTLLIPYEIALETYYLYNNNLKKIRLGVKSWMANPVRGYGEEASAEQMALAKHLNRAPNFLSNEHSYYGMAHFMDEDDGHLYAVGDWQDVRDAIHDMADTMLYGAGDKPSLNDVLETEYTWTYGTSELYEYIYIDDWALDEISKEDAHREIEDWYGDTAEDRLTYIADKRPDIEKDWEDLQGRRDDLEEMLRDTDNDNQAELLQDKIDDLDREIEKLAEIATDDIALELSDNNRKWMEDSPLDWLYEFGYIQKDGYNNWDIRRYAEGGMHSRKKNKYPEWIMVDKEALRDNLIEQLDYARSEELARYDGEEREEVYNGETYYIYKTE